VRRHAEGGEGVGHGFGVVEPESRDRLVGVRDVDARITEAGDVGFAMLMLGSRKPAMSEVLP
jgi:hypothetical protein